MAKCITICPIGGVDEGVLKHLEERISTHCDLSCTVCRGLEHPKYAYDYGRCQYDSRLILKRLLRCCPEDTTRFLGVTEVDLFVPILRFVYGLAQLDGRCLLVSVHRLRPQFYNLPPKGESLLSRVEKTALHELGHTFGLTHCQDRYCVMHSSSRIEDTDTKQPAFCPTCRELFRWQLERC